MDSSAGLLAIVSSMQTVSPMRAGLGSSLKTATPEKKGIGQQIVSSKERGIRSKRKKKKDKKVVSPQKVQVIFKDPAQYPSPISSKMGKGGGREGGIFFDVVSDQVRQPIQYRCEGLKQASSHPYSS